MRCLSPGIRATLAATALALLPAVAAAEEGVDMFTGPELRYVELQPAFVTNFGYSDTGHLSYVKANVTVRVASKAAEKAARYHLPALRNALVLLFARQDEATVSTSQGREQMRAEALAELNAILKQEEGETYIEDLLFTNFIVQR